MDVSTTAASTALVAASTTATVTLGSLIGMDALTVMFGLFGGFVALAFPITGSTTKQRHIVSITQVMAAGMVAASLTEVGLSYSLPFLQLSHEGAAKATAFMLGYLAKWLLPNLADTIIGARRIVKEFLTYWVNHK